MIYGNYHTAQNFDGGNIDEFPEIRQYFPHQNFQFSYVATYCFSLA